MTTVFRWLALAAAVVLAGCASISGGPSIPLPVITPFDANQMARMAYLDGFREGYQTVVYDRGRPTDLITGPYRLARELGWRAGAAEARRSLNAPEGDAFQR